LVLTIGAERCRVMPTQHKKDDRGVPLGACRLVTDQPRTRKEEMMLSKPILMSLIATATASLLADVVRADETLPNLAGTYLCEPQPAPCHSGKSFTVTQNGEQIEFKSDSGFVGHAKLTSRISLSGIPTWNSLGVITPENHIQWSNGTEWRKM
jgi:hypothetical protein